MSPSHMKKECFDNNTWETRDPEDARAGESTVREVSEDGECEYVNRSEATEDTDGKMMKVTWMRVNTGSVVAPEVRCWLVAQELGFGERSGVLFAGTYRVLVTNLIHAVVREWPHGHDDPRRDVCLPLRAHAKEGA